MGRSAAGRELKRSSACASIQLDAALGCAAYSAPECWLLLFPTASNCAFTALQEEVPGVLPGWGTWAGQQREPQWVTDAKRKAAQ